MRKKMLRCALGSGALGVTCILAALCVPAAASAAPDTPPPVATPLPPPPTQPPGPADAPPAPVPPAEAPPEAAPLPPPEGAPAPGEGYPTPAPPPGEQLPPGYYGSYPAPDQAFEEINPAPQGYREHEGLFLRVSIGVGAAITSYDEAVDGVKRSQVTTRGLAGLFGVSVGGRVAGNLILHGDLMAAGFGDANRQVDGTTDARDTIEGSLALLGGGVTYYFMPANAFATGILGVTSFSEQRDGEDSVQSGLGFGLSGLLGKEWWVGRRGEWALGGALRMAFYTAPLDIARVESQLGAFDIGVVFTTTYN
jgi:hypothetical protein